MTEEQKTDLYHRHHNLLKKLANQFSKRFPVSFEECLEEAEFAFGKMVGRWDDITVYDPKQSPSETTWVYQKVYWALMTFIRNRSRAVRTTPIEEGIDSEAKDPVGWLQRLLNEIGEESAFLVRTIIRAPADIANDLRPHKPAQAKQAITEYMVDVKDWSFARLEKSWREIQSCM